VPRETPERYRWAVDILAVRPDDQVLEVGCGYGHGIGLVSERLDSGRIAAIDRSDKMVEAAIESNRKHLDSGKAEILHQDLLGSLLPPASYDKIFLFNINAFWMDPAAELAQVSRLLKLDGLFYLFHQPPPDHEIEEFIERFKLNLTKNRFEICSINVETIEGKEMACLVSRPIRQ
jgi:SAM-dependent methyltransferase